MLNLEINIKTILVVKIKTKLLLKKLKNTKLEILKIGFLNLFAQLTLHKLNKLIFKEYGSCLILFYTCIKFFKTLGKRHSY